MASTAARMAARVLLAVVVAGCSTTNPTSSPPPERSPDVAPSAPVATAPGATPAATEATPSAAPAPASGTWARLEVAGDGPPAREDHTWTVAEDGRIAWLFGGRDGATVFDDLWTFDLETERWQRLPVDGPPAARFGHEAAWLPGHGLVIWAGQAGSDFFDDIWLLDPDGPTWKRLNVDGDKPVARYGSCSGIGPDGRLWISHGFTANGVRFDDTWTFDIEQLRWKERELAAEGQVPIKRCLHACWWTSGGQFALYGGQTNGVAALGDLWVLTPPAGGARGGWAEAPGQTAAARQLAGVARHEALTVIFGGRGTDGEVLSDTWVLPDGATVLAPLTVADAPPARSGAALIDDASGDRLVMFGGRGKDAFGDVWELTLP